MCIWENHSLKSSPLILVEYAGSKRDRLNSMYSSRLIFKLHVRCTEVTRKSLLGYDESGSFLFLKVKRESQ